MKKTLCLIAVLLIGAIFLSGCAEGKNGIGFDVGFADATVFGYTENGNGITFYGGGAVIYGAEELKEFCAKRNNGAFDTESADYSLTMSVKLREYDDEYFETKALIVYSLTDVNWERDPKIERISVKDTDLIIKISLKRGVFSDKAEIGTFLIEVNKEDVKNISDVVVEEAER